MAKDWVRVEVTVTKGTGWRKKSVRETLMVPEDLLTAAASVGNDYRQTAAGNRVATAFVKAYAKLCPGKDGSHWNYG